MRVWDIRVFFSILLALLILLFGRLSLVSAPTVVLHLNVFLAHTNRAPRCPGSLTCGPLLFFLFFVLLHEQLRFFLGFHSHIFGGVSLSVKVCLSEHVN